MDSDHAVFADGIGTYLVWLGVFFGVLSSLGFAAVGYLLVAYIRRRRRDAALAAMGLDPEQLRVEVRGAGSMAETIVLIGPQEKLDVAVGGGGGSDQ